MKQLFAFLFALYLATTALYGMKDNQDSRLNALTLTHNIPSKSIKSSSQDNITTISMASTPEYVWNKIRHITFATKSIFRQTLATIFQGTPLPLDDFRYEHERSSTDLKQESKIRVAQDMFVIQAVEESLARNFQIKRALTISSLATALCAGLTYCTLGFNRQMAETGVCISSTAGILSWLYFGNRAHIKEIAKRKQARILQLTALNISPQEAAEAYKRITGGPLFNGLRIYGFFGLKAILSMCNKVADNFSLTTSVCSTASSALTDLR
jgi:hypothetical protein